MLFVALLVISYISVLYISVYQYWGCCAALLTIPLSINNINSFKIGKLQDLCVDVAKMFLPFGILMVLGIQFTSRGFIL